MAIFRWLIITVSVVVLSTLGINAFDNLDAPGNSLLGAAFSSLTATECEKGMVLVRTSGADFCIDVFEASPSSDCVYKNPQHKKETDDNLLLQSCQARSIAGVMPWRNISRGQAELVCARAGKRLPTNKEWYRAALGTPDKSSGWGDDDCNVNDTKKDEPEVAGSKEQCVSSAGAYDMIGNVWEWLEETVDEGEYVTTLLPEEGYVADIDTEGVVRDTNPTQGDPSFFEDYFWINDAGVRGMLRGGYWRSKSDAGQYALNVTVPPSFVGNAVGFRCVKDIE